MGDAKEARGSGKITKRKLLLKVRGVQSGFGQEDVSEITVPGEYFFRDGIHYIFYTEYTEEGHAIKNRLTITREEAELRKTGNGGSVLTFRQGHAVPCHYRSPAGLLELVSDTKKIEFHCGRSGLKLILDYSFYMAGALMSDYHLTVSGTFRNGDTVS